MDTLDIVIGAALMVYAAGVPLAAVVLKSWHARNASCDDLRRMEDVALQTQGFLSVSAQQWLVASMMALAWPVLVLGHALGRLR